MYSPDYERPETEYSKYEQSWLKNYKPRQLPFAIPGNKRFEVAGIIKIDRKIYPKGMF